jgi:hypothetical protein
MESNLCLRINCLRRARQCGKCGMRHWSSCFGRAVHPSFPASHSCPPSLGNCRRDVTYRFDGANQSLRPFPCRIGSVHLQSARHYSRLLSPSRTASEQRFCHNSTVWCPALPCPSNQAKLFLTLRCIFLVLNYGPRLAHCTLSTLLVGDRV